MITIFKNNYNLDFDKSYITKYIQISREGLEGSPIGIEWDLMTKGGDDDVHHFDKKVLMKLLQ